MQINILTNLELKQKEKKRNQKTIYVDSVSMHKVKSEIY